MAIDPRTGQTIIDPFAARLLAAAQQPATSAPGGFLGPIALTAAGMLRERRAQERRAEARKEIGGLLAGLDFQDPTSVHSAMEVLAGIDDPMSQAAFKILMDRQLSPAAGPELRNVGDSLVAVSPDMQVQELYSAKPKMSEKMRLAYELIGVAPDAATPEQATEARKLAREMIKPISVSQTNLSGLGGEIQSIMRAAERGIIPPERAQQVIDAKLTGEARTPEGQAAATQQAKSEQAKSDVESDNVKTVARYKATVANLRNKAKNDIKSLSASDVAAFNQVRGQMGQALARKRNPERVTDADVEIAREEIPGIGSLLTGTYDARMEQLEAEMLPSAPSQGNMQPVPNQAPITDADINFTARKHGISPAEVRRRLKAAGRL